MPKLVSQEVRATTPLFDQKADSPLPDEVLRKKRNRYAEFEVEKTIREIAKKALGAQVLSIESLGSGSNNFDHLVFRVRTDQGRKVIFRINTDSLVAENFVIEAALYDHWREARLPSPEVYQVALREKSGDLDYMLLENLGTSDLEKYLQKKPFELLRLAKAAGIFLQRLHLLPVSGFGLLQCEKKVLSGSQETWSEAILTRLDENLIYLVQEKIITAKQAEEVRQVFAKNRSLLKLNQGVILHGDYHHGNILIDEEHGGIVAAIDLSQAKAGDPLYDLAFYGTYVLPATFQKFCEGYFGQSRKPLNWEKKIILYQLRIYLSKAKLRKRFGYDERIGNAVKGIKDCLEKLR